MVGKHEVMYGSVRCLWSVDKWSPRDDAGRQDGNTQSQLPSFLASISSDHQEHQTSTYRATANHEDFDTLCPLITSVVAGRLNLTARSSTGDHQNVEKYPVPATLAPHLDRTFPSPRRCSRSYLHHHRLRRLGLILSNPGIQDRNIRCVGTASRGAGQAREHLPGCRGEGGRCS